MRGVTKACKVFFGPKVSLARCWLFAGILLALLMPVVQAQSIQWRSATLAVVDDSWTTNADFDIELSPRMEEVLGNGVALYFVAELELTRPRWYWLDERVLSERLTMRLGYQPLLRQYRLSSGVLHRNFSSLSEALQELGRIRGWQVAERERLKPGEPYKAFVRMRFDSSQLPRLMQVGPGAARDWNLQSEWQRFNLTPSATESGSR
jgi:hypothetical protein